MLNRSDQIDNIFLDDFVIPLFKVKPIYTIGDVSEILNEKQYVIRFWESEFGDLIKPIRGRGNRRLYKRSDIVNFLKIKHLLKVKQFTISGAKKVLKIKDLRDKIDEVVCTPNNEDKLRFVTEQMKLLISDIERIRDNLLKFD